MKTITFKRQSSRVLFRFTVSYLLMMIIPVIMAATAYTIALRSSENQVVRTNELALERAVSEIDCSLSEADTFVHSLSTLSVLDRVFSDDHDAAFLQAAISELPEFTDIYGIIQRYFIYAPDKELIIDPRNAYVNLRNYYATAFRYGNLPLEAFISDVLNSKNLPCLFPVADNTYILKNYQSMLYVQRLVLPSRKSGRVVFYLDQDALLQRLRLHFGDSIGFTGILGNDGSFLMSTDNELSEMIHADISTASGNGSFRSTQKDMLVSFHSSEHLMGKLIIAIPLQYISDQLRNVLTAMITGLGLMLAVGLALGLALFFHNRKPLAAAIETLPSPNEESRPRGLYWLEYAVRDLAESHEQLEASIQLQRMELQNAAVHRLINGGEKTEAGIESLLDYVGIHLNGDWFRAILVRTGHDEEWDETMTPNGDIRRANIRQTLSTLEPDIVFLGIQSQNICALIQVGQEEQAEDAGLYHRLYQKLLEAGETGAIISVGPKQHSLVALYRSFTIAEQQMERAPDGSWLLSESNGNEQNYHFTMHDEQRLGNLAANGNLDEINAALDHLWNENFVKRNITGFEREMLYYRIMDTAIQAAGDPELIGEERHLIARLNPDAFFSMIRQKFNQVCDSVKEKRQQSSNTLLDEITTYVRECYSDCNMCLASAAMRFGLTEKYLSAFFKEKAGINFSNYLENLRMEKATELLSSTQLTIEEISRQVGYNSAKSFSRAFYRCKGYTPSQGRGAN